MSKEELKTYLAEIIELETKRYEISLAVSELEEKRITYNRIRNREILREIREMKWTRSRWTDILKSAFVAGLAGVMAGAAGSFFLEKLPWISLRRVHVNTGINMLLGFAAFFAAALVILALQGIMEIYAYNQSVRIHNRNRERRNKEIIRESRHAKEQLRILEGELLRLRDGYGKADAGLKKLYGNGTIYSKYRRLSPVSRFYEYIASGRCLGLEGPEGAYDLYEKERYMEMVLDVLDHETLKSPHAGAVDSTACRR